MKPRRKTPSQAVGKQSICKTCRHAHLLQFGQDPVLADCTLHNGHPRQVANYGSCADYETSPFQKPIDKKVKTQWFENK